MSDYISRDVAVNGLAKIINESDMPEDWNKGMSAAMSALFRIPTADVRPVVLGKWTLFGRRGIYGVMYECSACRAKYDGRTNFCPNCGAMMEES